MPLKISYFASHKQAGAPALVGTTILPVTTVIHVRLMTRTVDSAHWVTGISPYPDGDNRAKSHRIPNTRFSAYRGRDYKTQKHSR